MNKLEKMLKYVSNNNEFYMNIISSYGISSPEQITQYPIITREVLQRVIRIRCYQMNISLII